jgi:hypothetical protein
MKDKLTLNSCWNVHVLYKLPSIPITSPTAILNLPVNSFFLDTALILTSDNKSLSSLPSLLRLALTWNCHVALPLRVFIYIHFLLTDKDLCECQKAPHFPYTLLCVSFVWRPLHFVLKTYPLLFLLLCYPYFVIFPFPPDLLYLHLS